MKNELLVPYSTLYYASSSLLLSDDVEPACFVCGCDIHPTAPLVMISRNWVVHDETEHIDILTSLQSCIACSYICAQRNIEWECTPRLQEIEWQAFYFFCKRIAAMYDQTLVDRMVNWDSLPGEMLLDIPFYFLFQYPDEMVGGRHRPGNTFVSSAMHCLNCLQLFDPNDSHMVIQISVEVLNGGFQIYPDLPFARYCRSCSKSLFAVEDEGFVTDASKDIFT